MKLSLRPGPKSAKPLHESQRRGKIAEEVAEAYFVRQGCRIVAKNIKTRFAEVDLIVESAKGVYYLVEVKTAAHPHFERYRVGLRQYKRLRRAFMQLEQSFRPLRSVLLCVGPAGEIQFFKDFLTD